MASPSSSARQALEAIGVRLREIRIDAGLTGRALALLAGWPPSKVSKLEYGRQPPSIDDIRIWCRYCGAEDQSADLVASLRIAEGMYVEWRRIHQTGLRRFQAARLPLYMRTTRFRIYEPGVIPGLFQTQGYAESILRAIHEFRQLPHDDIQAAVAARLERQQVLTVGRRRFAVVLEESALWTCIGGHEIMASQLQHLCEIATYPSVALSVIPANANRTMWPVEGFWIFDGAQVSVELASASVTVTQPHEIAVYAQAFNELSGIALHGSAARQLVRTVIDRLDAPL